MCPYNELDNLWQALYQLFNSAQNKPINFQLLDKISLSLKADWLSFSKAKFTNAISECSRLSTPGLDHIF